ncbi:MAG: hypothetical protein ACE15C_12440 [Phycisphaerae bacterium]
MSTRAVLAALIVTLLGAAQIAAAQATSQPAVVSNIKVLSDKVQDVSSLEAWKAWAIKEGMSDKDKALAVFKTEVMFQMADAPPYEFLQRENAVLDPIKMFNVYGYTLCSVSAANMACLGRYAGLKARNLTIQNHVVPEFFYDNAWHMLDGDLIEYFPKADGSLASVQEIADAIQAWLKENPDFSVAPKDKQARYKWMNANGNQWKTKGPEILSRNPYYDANGWLPDTNFAWGDTMQQFSKIANNWQSCYSMGYRVNIQLRPGEKLTRNWFNKGLHVNQGVGKDPEALKGKVGQGSMKYLLAWGDLAPGRVGNGTLEYDVPLATGEFRGAALRADNLACKSEDGAGPAVHVKDPSAQGVLDIRMPSSYVYLTGQLAFTPVIGEGGEIKVLLSDNNGLDWKDVAAVTEAGDQKIDIKDKLARRYCYIVRFAMKGKGTGLDALKITHDVQHSQRALPALDQGENKISFSAGPQEGTITIEGACDLDPKDQGKQLRWTDFHPAVEGFTDKPRSDGKGGSATYTVKTPGDLARLRISDYFVSTGKDSMFLIEASFDDGKTWKLVDEPTAADMDQERIFVSHYVTVSDVPAGTRSAQVRYRAKGNNTVFLVNARIDADYKEPAGGFRPVKVTYLWEEGGLEKKDEHVASKADETWTIKCETKPLMKSIILELAK